MEKIKLDINVFNTDEEIDKMYQAYLDCPAAVKEIKRLGIPEDKVKFYIVKIYDFVDDIIHCKNCPGVKKCHKTNPLLCTKLTYENGVVDRELVPCSKILSSVKIESKFLFKDYDEKYNDCTAKNIDGKIPQKREILKHYIDYTKGLTDKWMYIHSETVSGKSFVAAALANSFARNMEGTVGFINTSFRFRELADYSYGESATFEDVITAMCDCTFLVIDDLGNEYKNDFIRDAILYRILSTRASKNLMTVITSDYSIDEIVELYSTNKAASLRARQLGKVLNSKCDVINMSNVLKGLY